MTDLHARQSNAQSHNASDSVAQYIAQADPPSESTMLGIFDVLRDGWFDKKSSGDAPNLVEQITALAVELDLDRPAEFGASLQVLIRGAAATPHETRVQALFYARNLARLLLSSHRIGSSIDEYELPAFEHDVLFAGTTQTPPPAVRQSSEPVVYTSDFDFDLDFDLAV